MEVAMRVNDRAIFAATSRSPVSVLMPAYNAAGTIEAAVRSIIGQTFTDWRLLIIDDGSTDATPEICERLSASDPRILYRRSEHLGVYGVSTLGLRLLGSRYVARMDADDISYSERLARQMEFLSRHPEVKVLGTRAYRINDRGRRITLLGDGPATLAEYQAQLARRELFFLLHSSVVADRQTMLEHGGYRREDYPAEDVALFTRIAQHHPVLMLPNRLVGYRVTLGGISTTTQERMILQWMRFHHNLQHGESLTCEQYAQRIRRSLRARARLRMGCLYKSAVRRGAYYFFNGRLLLGACYLLAGAVFEPWTVAKRVLRWT
jgi:glycosyltransferase involved in cell wall biosynthesis